MAWRTVFLQRKRLVRISVTPLLVTRKVAGYGLPGLFAKQCNVKVVRVQLPCLPFRWLKRLSGTIWLDGEADITSRF